MARAPNALRQLLEAHTRARGLPLSLVAEVDSVQTVLSLVARGVAATVLPASAARLWTYAQPLHLAALHTPTIRNRVALAVPRARPATRPSRLVARLLRELVSLQYGALPGAPR